LPPHITLKQAKAFANTFQQADPSEYAVIKGDVKELADSMLAAADPRPIIRFSHPIDILSDRCMSRHMIQRTTVRLPEDLLKRAKRKAAAEGRTLTSLIEDGLRRVIAEGRSAAKPAHHAPNDQGKRRTDARPRLY
jgi:hypothetical protein